MVVPHSVDGQRSKCDAGQSQVDQASSWSQRERTTNIKKKYRVLVRVVFRHQSSPIRARQKVMPLRSTPLDVSFALCFGAAAAAAAAPFAISKFVRFAFVMPLFLPHREDPLGQGYRGWGKGALLHRVRWGCGAVVMSGCHDVMDVTMWWC